MTRRLFFSVLVVVTAAMSAQVRDALADAANRFAHAYNEFFTNVGKGIFDRKRALELSRLWRGIENSGEWPRTD